MDRVTVEQAVRILGIKAESLRKYIGGGKKHPGLAQEPVDDLHDRISYLERQLEERESCRRADHIIARLVGRVPALEAAPGEQETAESRDVGAEGAVEPGVGVGHPPGNTGCSEGSDRPPDTAERPVRGTLLHPWWKRVYGR
jgi:hypothetical protein